MRFSPAPAPGAAPRLTAFAGLRAAPAFITGGAFESAVPSGAGDTRRSSFFSPGGFLSDASEDEIENVFDADCRNGIVTVAVAMPPFCGERCGSGKIDGNEEVEASEATIGADGLSASTGADCVSNSAGGTWVRGKPLRSVGERVGSRHGTCLGCRMYARDQLGTLAVAFVVLLQELAGLLVEGRVWIRVNKQALDRDEDVREAVRRLPVFFESVDANLACARHVGMEYLGDEPACSTLT